MIIRLHTCEIDTDRIEILTSVEMKSAEPQVFRLLLYLIEIRDESFMKLNERSSQAIDQTIRFCTAPDGVRLSYAVTEEGRAVVKSMSWLNYLEFDWESSVFSDLFRRLTAQHLLMRYDSRRTGLSDRDAENYSFEALASNLEASVNESDLESFAVLGTSQDAALAIDYAARYPEKATHLIL